MLTIQGEIARNLPAFLRADPDSQAVAAAEQAGIDWLLSAIAQADAMLTDPWAMPEWRLDEVAWENNIAWYDHAADVAVKRNLVASAQRYFSVLGTRAAIRQACEDYFGDATMEEWYQYGGEPYHFRVTSANSAAAAENGEKLKSIVAMVKNARSVFDGIYVVVTAEVGVYAAAGLWTHQTITFEVV